MRLHWALAAAFALALAGAAPAAAQSTAYSSGPLTAMVNHDPFQIEFRDARSGEVLRTLGGGPPAPDSPTARYGPLGYSFDLRQPVVNNAYFGYYIAAEQETVWFHATRLLAPARAKPAGRNGGLTLLAETNDPLGHRLEITLTSAGDGGITVDSKLAPGSGPLAGVPGQPSLSGASFEVGAPTERFLGFGERSNAADQTGNYVFSWAEEGPFSSGRYEDLVSAVMPDFTFPTGPTTTNFPIPWMVSTRGYGLLIDQPERSYFRLASDRTDAWNASAESSHFRFTVFAGPDPAGAVHRYSDYAGRQPDPAPWIFGPWFQPTLEKAPDEIAKAFRDNDSPATVIQTYTHYLPCGAHVGREQAEADRVKRAHDLGYKITTYFNPHVCTEYEPVYSEAASRGLFIKNQAGQPYLLSNPFTADETISEIDFTNPEARAFYGELLDDALTAGYDGWMEDFGEYTPTDSVAHDGRGGRELHNPYTVEYHCASYEHSKRQAPAVYIRSGFHGVQPCARVVWGGDPTEDWSCSDGLCAAVHQLLSTGLSGIAYQGSDIGGFHAVVNDRTNDELNSRWIQVGAVSGVMRTQANGYSFRDNRAQRSQVWHPAVFPIWRRYSKLRTQLFPYINRASQIYQATAMPIARHLALVYPRDPSAIVQQRSFMFGEDLLIAPVLNPGQTEQTTYLPRGERWIDFWRAVGYHQRAGSFDLRRRAKLIKGGRTATVPAPLDELPMFVRAGAIVPFLWNDVDTLADEGNDRRTVRLADRAHKLKFLAFPRGRSVRRLHDGGKVISAEKRARRVRAGRTRSGKPRSRTIPRRWILRIKGAPRRKTYKLRASFTTLKGGNFRPCKLYAGGRRLPRKQWSYRAKTGVLVAKWKLRNGKLAAVGCAGKRR